MKYRKLRIAFSAVCGVLCLLLIVLWVRSYQSPDFIRASLKSGRMVYVHSILGRLDFTTFQPITPDPAEWKIITFDDDWDEESKAHWRLDEGETTCGFKLVWSEHEFDAIVPYWFFLTVTVAAVVLPWIRWRFSLRTLLIATTVIAVVLGAIIYAAR